MSGIRKIIPIFPPNTVRLAPYTPAIVCGDTIYVSGSLGIDGDKKLVEGGTAAQAKQALENMKAVLEAAGSDIDHVLKVSVLLTNMDDFAAVNEVYGKAFCNGTFPARTCFAVKELPMKASVEIECIALKY